MPTRPFRAAASPPAPAPHPPASAVGEGAVVAELVGQSAHILAVRERCARLAPTNFTVVIEGETGTGKYVVAQLLHRLSGRGGRFVVGAGGEVAPTLAHSELFGHVKGAFTGATERRIGLLETAHGGTALLDELQDLPREVQMVLRGFLDGHGFSPLGTSVRIQPEVRVVVACQAPLEKLVRKGTLRRDLMYRVQQETIELMPLRERMEDLEPLAEHIVRRAAGRLGVEAGGVSAAALRDLSAHAWPGNVRELENVLGSATFAAAGSKIQPWHLPGRFYEVLRSGRRGPKVVPVARERVVAALGLTRGDVAKASRELGVSDRQVRRYVKDWKIDLKRIRGRGF